MAEENDVLEGRKIWLIKHPISKYYQETKKQIRKLAIANDLKIVCESRKSFIDPKLIAKDVPKLTPIETKEPAKKKTKEPAKTEE